MALIMPPKSPDLQMTRRQTLLIAAAVIIAIGGFIAWRLLRPTASPDTLTLYGNVDLRQVELGAL